MKLQQILAVSTAVLVAVSLAACSSTAPRKMAAMEKPSMTQAPDAEMVKQQAELLSRNQQLEQEKAQMQEQLRAARLAASQAQPAPMAAPRASADEMLLPPQAAPGQCFARIFIPPTYRTVSEKVLKRAASEKVAVIPAKYETATERVLVKAAAERMEVVPATYAWEEEKVLVEPAKTRLVQVPATYETVSEKMLVKAAHTTWKKGTGPIQRIDQGTGEIMCLVEVPAEYRTVSKTVMKTAPATRSEEIPAVYKTVKKQVMVTPPSTKVVQIPEEYRTVKVTKLVTPAREVRTPIAEEYQTVTKQEQVTDGKMEWREILCDTNMTNTKVSQVQRALQQAGYNPGPVDGVIGSQTMQAVNSFQKDKNLVVSQYLTIDTVNALGVGAR